MTATASPPAALKVSLLCTGVGRFRGGIESFFRECFDGLHTTPGLDMHLFKGAGDNTPHEHRLLSLDRNKPLAKCLGKVLRRQSYTIELLSSIPAYIRAIRSYRPDVLFTSDAALMRRLHPLRKKIGVPFRIVFSNGGPMIPPYQGEDFIHQVAPHYLQEALDAGIPALRMAMIPYGLTIPDGPPLTDPAARLATRRRLGLPLDRKIILSVGWLSATHKRMDYTIREVAQLPAPRPLLVMLGRKDESTPAIVKLAQELLGPENFIADSLPYEQVAAYYDAADLFTLSSLTEGFGRVFIEALCAGLPAIVHDNPVMRYVLADYGTYKNLNQPGALAAALAQELQHPLQTEGMIARRESVRQRFSWPALADSYRQMFETARQIDFR